MGDALVQDLDGSHCKCYHHRNGQFLQDVQRALDVVDL